MVEFRDCPSESKAVIQAWVDLMMAYRSVLPLGQIWRDIDDIFDLPPVKPTASPVSKERAAQIRQYKEQATEQFDQDVKVLLGLTLVLLGKSQERPGSLADARRDIYQLLDQCTVAWALVLLWWAKELVHTYLMMAELPAFQVIQKQATAAEKTLTRAQVALLVAESLKADVGARVKKARVVSKKLAGG